MSAAAVTRWARRFLAASALFLVAWQVAALLAVLPEWQMAVPALASIPRQTQVVLAVHGFVLHAVFGKAYSLVPSYFDRSLAIPQAPAVQLPLTAAGAVGSAVGSLPGVPEVVSLVGTLGAVLWAAGVVVFVAALAWTLRDNPTGRETGTSEANAHRRRVDRFANAFVPVVLGYLLVGAYGTITGQIAVPDPFPVLAFAQTAHLLAAGIAALLIFVVGFRLFPRFLVASPPSTLVAVVLPAGAVGPAILAWNLYRNPWFRVGAVLQAIAIVGFAATYAVLFARSDRRRVGFYAVLFAVGAGVLGVLVGLQFALGGFATVPFAGSGFVLVDAHFRLNVLGVLGLTIMGATYQFRPPTVGAFPGASDRTALTAAALVGLGLLGELGGAIAGVELAVGVGRAVALAGAAIFAYLLLGVFRER